MLQTFDGKELIVCIKKLISLDSEWVPYSKNDSLYIRPTLIGIEVSRWTYFHFKLIFFVWNFDTESEFLCMFLCLFF